MRMKQKIGAVKWMPLFPNAGNAALRNARRKNVWQILVRSDVLSVTTRDTLVRTVVLKVHRGKDQKSSKSKGKGFGKKGKLNEVSEEGHDQSDAWWHELLLGCPYSFLCYGISWRLESFQTGISFHPTLQCGWGVRLGMVPRWWLEHVGALGWLPKCMTVGMAASCKIGRFECHVRVCSVANFESLSRGPWPQVFALLKITIPTNAWDVYLGVKLPPVLRATWVSCQEGLV